MMIRPQFATTTTTMTILRFLLFALAVSDTSAVFCDFYDERFNVTVSNQEELEAKYAGCTEIKGTINIARNYTGPFYLPNLTSITGGITTGYADEDPIPTPLLTSIDVPDLNDTLFIDINTVPALKTVSFPSLTVLNGYLELSGIDDCSGNFPSLTATRGLMITGNSTRLNFPLLADVEYMRVSRNLLKDDDSNRSEYLLVERVQQLPLDISFPALKSATFIYLQGNISSLSMPLLSTIESGSKTIRILTHGNPLNISLPSLSSVQEISVAGTIGSTYFPSLLSLDTFLLNTSSPLNVTLEPLQSISTELYLVGNVTATSMSTITTLGTVSINSTLDDVDCSSFAAAYQRAKGFAPNDDQCTGPIHPPKNKLLDPIPPPKNKLPLQLGLSLGLGIPLFLAFCYCIFWASKRLGRRRKARHLAKFDKPPGYELGAPPTYATDGPPTYAAAAAEQEESGSDREAGGVAADVRAADGSGAHAHGEGEGEGEHRAGAGDVAGAPTRPSDGSTAHGEGAASGRRVV